MEDNYINEFNRTLLGNFKLKTKVLLTFFSVILLMQLAFIFYVVTQTNLIGNEIPKNILLLGPFLLLSIISAELITIHFLNKSIEQGAEIKISFFFFVVFLEVSFPTMVMYFVGNFTDFETTLISTHQLLNSPLFLVYILMIILSSLLLNFRLCVSAGLVAAFEYLLLNFFFLYGNVDELDLMSNVFRCIFIFLAGIISGLVSRKIRDSIHSELSAKGELISTLDIKVREKTQEVVSQKNEIEKKNHLLTEKNKEITDSITYAKRLQDAILPPEQFIKTHLPESFIFYRPKDIVAGDFYWMETASVAEHVEAPKRKITLISGTSRSSVSDIILFAAADCTGHGVPGAMVSVVCHNALNRSVKEFGLIEPGKILDKTKELVVETFTKSNTDVKDGMDISLCSIKYQVESIKTKEKPKVNAIIQWAGANNPLWVVRCHAEQSDSEAKNLTSTNEEIDASFVSMSEKDFSTPLEMTTHKNQSDTSMLRQAQQPNTSVTDSSQYSLQELKADKQPIGKTDIEKPFTTHTIELQKGDIVYLFTDGFADQFGGEKGKKFMYKPLKELLLKNAALPMEQQKTLLQEAFLKWTNTAHQCYEQVDDVCIVGIRI